jgi:TRAP-type uncharacterized transport system substrate-binding protein
VNRRKELSIATTSPRAQIAVEVALSFYRGASLPLASQVALALGYRDSNLGGIGILSLVDQKKFDFGFANPSGLARMALLGRGPYRKKLALRAVGVFPSWDRLVFAVRKDTGIRSLEEIKEKKYSLSVSTRSGGRHHTTLYIIDEVLRAYGFSLADIMKWGGKILRVSRPSGPDRAEHIRSGTANAVFDEGIKSWGDWALEAGMRFLPVREDVLKRMQGFGFGGAPLTRAAFPNLEEEITTVDFSGWTFLCHQKLPGALAYQMATAIDRCHERIRADHLNRKTMTMQEFCRGGDGGPVAIPLHPGAKKYYREKGYL